MTATLHALDFGDLRRVTPIDPHFGGRRGKPVDRHYIERFLADHAADIQGRVLEVAEDHYTWRYGGNRVEQSDIIHVDPSNPRATLVADLADAGGIENDSFDCFICTQTLTYIYDVQSALATIHRILRPGGVLLATVPGISQISPYDRDRWASTGASRRSRCAACWPNRSSPSTSASRRTATSSRRPHSCKVWPSRTCATTSSTTTISATKC